MTSIALTSGQFSELLNWFLISGVAGGVSGSLLVQLVLPALWSAMNWVSAALGVGRFTLRLINRARARRGLRSLTLEECDERC